MEDRFDVGDLISDNYVTYVVLRSDIIPDNSYYDAVLVVKSSRFNEFIKTQDEKLTEWLYGEDMYYDYYIVEKSKYKIKTIYKLV